MAKALYNSDLLLTGTDGGNNANKISFLNAKGNIESFTIPTIIAKAAPHKIEFKVKSGQRDVLLEDELHLYMESTALPSEYYRSYWYVGESAKSQPSPIQPDGETKNKFGNLLHTVTTLAGLAVAALKSGKEKVIAPYSGGLPYREYKEVGPDRVLEALKGTHIVRVVSGKYEGKQVTIEISEGTVNVEGVTSSLALSFDIVKGDLVVTPLSEKVLNKEFALGDLGAGTMDMAYYDDKGFNPDISDNNTVGTNAYIDDIIREIKNLPKFQQYAEELEDDGIVNPTPYPTRENFIQEVVAKEVEKMVEDNDYSPAFYASWGPVRKVDVTEIVTKYMQEYGKNAVRLLRKFWSRANADNFVIVGGGLLFGYIVIKEYRDQFIFPPHIMDAAHFTSRAYLIASYYDQLEKIETKAK
jgi:plasmid segregation protein ParM